MSIWKMQAGTGNKKHLYRLLDSNGYPLTTYTMSAKDARSIIKGMKYECLKTGLEESTMNYNLDMHNDADGIKEEETI